MRRLAVLWPLPVLAALLALAWGLARALPQPEPAIKPAPVAEPVTPPPALLDPYAALVARLPKDPAPAAVAAEVFTDFHIRLRREDIAAWNALVANGTPAAQALRTVIDYRRASGATP